MFYMIGGLACDKDGLALGDVQLAMVRLGAEGLRRCETRAPGDVGRILRTAYGPQSDEVVSRLHRGLCRAAAAIEVGDLGRAGIEAVKLGLPDLTPDAMEKLAEINDLEKSSAAWETEPRILAGQTGAGQWTTDGEGTLKPVVRPVRNGRVEGARHRPPARSRNRRGIPEGSSLRDAGSLNPIDSSLLVHISTATSAFGGFGLPGEFTMPKFVGRLGRAGLLPFAASLLDAFVIHSAQDQIAKAVIRFGLKPNRPTDMTAASAYVWSRYDLPNLIREAPYTGPALDAASKAVMRFVLVNPGAFVAMRQDSKSHSLIIDAANGGLADYASESRARPAGVDPALQTTSRAARAAIADSLKTGDMQAHHLVPANVWKKNIDISKLALKDGWRPDDPSNLIALPSNAKTQAMFGWVLPIHNSAHRIYNADTEAQIVLARSQFSNQLTPLEAHAILDSVALHNRIRILLGVYGRIMRASQ